MKPPLRVGGRGRLADGALVTWSVAEGIRGRRWRASVADGDELRAIALLEVDVDGWPTKLELATPTGLLTVHPEPDAVLHGNVVTALGIRPISVPAGTSFGIDVEGLPVPAAVACHGLAGSVGVGEGIELHVVRIGLDLSVRSEVAQVRRLAAGEWTIDGVRVAVDDRGVAAFDDGEEWPLEADDAGAAPAP